MGLPREKIRRTIRPIHGTQQQLKLMLEPLQQFELQERSVRVLTSGTDGKHDSKKLII